jgi:site-specific recombinase XerD
LTIVNELRQVAHLSRWMLAAEVAAGDLTKEHVEQFLAPRRAAKGGRACSFQGLVLLLEVLIERGVRVDGLAASPPVSVHEATLARFRRFLFAERGLATCTADAYVGYAGQFLEGLNVDGELADLDAGDVTRAVQREAARVSIGSTQYFVAGLRAFLRFCFLEGRVGADLSAAALAVTGRRHSSLPKGISGADATALLRSCDRRRSEGRRDYAVLLVLLRLGLRAGEVAGLALGDVDWRAGEIVVRGKGRREDRFPLPFDVGEAIAGYLRRGRPRTSRRELFLRVLAPIAPLSRGGVSSIVRRACRRVGIAEVGAHRLRHTVACEMVTAGVPLPEIGEMLRHRSIASTAVYARVDLDTLRGVALPWPGGDGR